VPFEQTDERFVAVSRLIARSNFFAERGGFIGRGEMFFRREVNRGQNARFTGMSAA